MTNFERLTCLSMDDFINDYLKLIKGWFKQSYYVCDSCPFSDYCEDTDDGENACECAISKWGNAEYVKNFDIKPCPFRCGTNTKILQDSCNEYFWVRYTDCGANTVPRGTKEQAVKSWNKREANNND